jgi:hypothetical protein
MLGHVLIEHRLGAQRPPCIDGRYDIAEKAFLAFVVRRKLLRQVSKALLQVVAETLFLAPELRQLSGPRDVSAKQLVLREERDSDVFECIHGSSLPRQESIENALPWYALTS